MTPMAKGAASVLLSALLLAACASAGSAPASQDAAADRISNGMQRLGASQMRGDCFAEQVAASLDREAAEEAAAIVERSQSKDEMRDGVLDARRTVRQAFIRANFGCGRA